eukprot:jgi/Orpsp1_1/1175763/evm.model.c7180000055119.3
MEESVYRRYSENREVRLVKEICTNAERYIIVQPQSIEMPEPRNFKIKPKNLDELVEET